MEKFIQLGKDSVLRIGIKTVDGKETGKFLEFDLEDIEFPLKLQKCEEEHRKNLQYIKNQFTIIDKKQDHKGKKLLSANEEEKIKTIKEFYKREMSALDLFLGEGGTLKLLNGRKPYYSMYDDIGEMLKPILPLLEQSKDNIINKVKEKYQTKKDDVLE